MTQSQNQPSREEVLDAFAVEPVPGGETLERYLRAYPALAADLVDLAHELSRPTAADNTPLSAAEVSRIDAAWRRHVGAPASPVADPLAALTIADLRAVARDLGVPRQVVAAFREHRVDVASVPRAFLARLAAAVHSTREALATALAVPPTLNPARSYKAETKPSAESPITFEQLLRDADVSDAERAVLLADGD